MNGVRAGVVAGVGEFVAEANDRVLDLGRRCARARSRPSRASLQGFVATFEAGDELIDPTARDPVRLGKLSRAAPLHQHRVHHIAPQSHSDTPAERGCPLCRETSVRYVAKHSTLSPAKCDVSG